MNQLNPLTQEALSVIHAIYEDHLEDRYAYRNEIHRLTASGLSNAFGSLEHFLDRYGYISIDQRHDALHLTSSGLAAAQGDSSRLKSLNDDIQYHFAKEIAEGVIKDAQKINAGKRFDQHYIRFEGIGRGGMGSVWRAEHLKTGRAVAIKTLEGIDEVVTSGRKSALKKRLERKIRQLAELDHPFICPILDLSVHHTPPYYVMPLYTGGSLRDLLAKGPLQPEIALNLFSQICLGLHHAHQQGVLHLDLKPENILIDQRGNIRLFDFGMSRTIAKQVSQAGRQSYIGLGSVAYMAPELLRDPQAEAASIDIYALGLVLYEMLIGELPGRRSPMPSDVIQGLPQPIDDLFDSMTQDSVQQRPQDMQAVLDILNQVPPFDRLFSQSMVMTFISPPFELPGLKHLTLPEFEESLDFQKSDKDVGTYRSIESSASGRQLRQMAATEVKTKTEEMITHSESLQSKQVQVNPKTQDHSSMSFNENSAVESISVEVPSTHQEISNTVTQTNQNISAHSHLDQVEPADSNLATTGISTISPLSTPVTQPKENQDVEANQGIEEVELEEIEELEDMVEVEEPTHQNLADDSSVFSSAPRTGHQSFVSSTRNPTTQEQDMQAIAQEAASRFEEALDDDFADDEKTALHSRLPQEDKPHLSQPHITRRSHSIAQQLFEQQRKGNQFKQ